MTAGKLASTKTHSGLSQDWFARRDAPQSAHDPLYLDNLLASRAESYVPLWQLEGTHHLPKLRIPSKISW